MIRPLPEPALGPARHAATAGRRAALRRLAERVRQAFGPDVLVADVGAGDGLLGDVLGERGGPASLGFDVAPRGACVVAADAHALPLRDGAVDVAVMRYALDQLRDPARALAELARVARRGGVVEHPMDGNGGTGWPGRSRVRIDGPGDVLACLPPGADWDGDRYFVWRRPGGNRGGA